MCQGVIVNLYKFQDSQGRTRRITSAGIGSHSELTKADAEMLKKRGWNPNDPNCTIISIESDFRAWNKYTISSGAPDKREAGMLARAYKNVADNAIYLIRHVKRCGKIDEGLVALLTPPAEKAYNEARAPARKAYDEARAAAGKAYNEAMAATGKAYDEAMAAARKAYDEAMAPARKAYDEARAAAWCKLFAKKSNRVEHLR